MFESVYLTSIEKKEFIQEFAEGIITALEKEEGKGKAETDKEREEALEKVRLIIRQFPNLRARTVAVPGIRTAEIPSTEQFLTGTTKVDSLLLDPKVSMIECSDGVIKISKGSGIEETGFRLDEREIKELINKFSEKTKIPLVGSLFKASFENLIITAVVSDIIGSRFLIIIT